MGVPDVVAAFLRADDPSRSRPSRQCSHAHIGRLAAAAGIEHGPLQEDCVRLSVDPRPRKPPIARAYASV